MMPKHKQMPATKKSMQRRDRFQSPHLVSKQTTSDRWLISVVMGDSPRAQARGMPGCVGELKRSFHVDFNRSHLAVAYFQVSFTMSPS